MDGKDVNVYINTCGMMPDDVVEMMMDDSEMMLGVLIASRGTIQNEICGAMKEMTEDNRFFTGCYKVAGMEDLGCAMCASRNGGKGCDK